MRRELQLVAHPPFPLPFSLWGSQKTQVNNPNHKRHTKLKSLIIGMNSTVRAGAKQLVGLLKASAEEHQQREGSCNSSQPCLHQEEPPPCFLGSTSVVPVSQATDLFVSYFSRAVCQKEVGPDQKLSPSSVCLMLIICCHLQIKLASRTSRVPLRIIMEPFLWGKEEKTAGLLARTKSLSTDVDPSSWMTASQTVNRKVRNTCAPQLHCHYLTAPAQG